MTEHDHPAVSIAIPDGLTKSAENRDGALLDVSVTNALPCVNFLLSLVSIPQLSKRQDFLIDEVKLWVAGRDGSRLAFAGGEVTLAPGQSTITLFCPVSPVVLAFRLQVG